MVTVAQARANVISQVVDGSPNSITPPKLRTLLTDIIDAIIGSVPASKLDATAAPTANDDISNTSGNGIFTVGSFWIDTAGDNAYRCVDSSTGAAVWVTTTLSADDLGALAVLNTVDTAQIADSAVTLAKIAAAAKSGADATLITGTKGANGTLAAWNADGDAVAGPSSTNPQFTTIELGHATDTTLARSAAGVVTIEGKVVPSPASQASGDLLYRGASSWLRLAKGTASQVLQMNSGATAPEWADDSGSDYIFATEQATTSGTEFNFTGIPAGVNEIIMRFSGVGTNGTDNLLVRLGDTGGYETTGYTSAASTLGSSTMASSSSTIGFLIRLSAAAGEHSGSLIIKKQNSAGTMWAVTGVLTRTGTGIVTVSGGIKTLSDQLDKIRLTRDGTDTFDAGVVSISYK